MTTKQAGFTLLEAMVALVILASASMSIYALFNTNLITLTRVRETTQEIPLARHAIRYLSAMNLTAPASGEFEVDGALIRWNAELVEPYRQSQNGRGFMGYFQLGLYNVTFTIFADGEALGTHELRVVGHEKVREPS